MRPVIDLDMLQTVVTHRYDVMAKYIKSLHRLAAEEFSRLKIGARESRMMKHLLDKDRAVLPGPQQVQLAALLDQSDRLAKMYMMRLELEAIWTRSSATHDQLLHQLKDWVERAERSGIQQLEEFSLRFRSYAV